MDQACTSTTLVAPGLALTAISSTRLAAEAPSRALASLSDRASRQVFTYTVRGTVTWSGQRLGASDRLYLLSGLPAARALAAEISVWTLHVGQNPYGERRGFGPDRIEPSRDEPEYRDQP